VLWLSENIKLLLGASMKLLYAKLG